MAVGHSDEALPALVEVLRCKDAERTASSLAARVLPKLGAPVVPHLAAALKDPDPWLKKQVLGVLAQMGVAASPAAPAVEAATKDADADVAKAAAEALKAIPAKK